MKKSDQDISPQELLEMLEKDTSHLSEDGSNAGAKTGISRKRKFKIVCDILYVLLVVFLVSILISVLTARSNGQTPELFGYRLYAVQSSSMSPTLDVGSILLTRRPADAKALRVGNIITFSISDSVVVTHRIIEVVTTEDGLIAYRTQGDNPLNSPDRDLVLPEQIESVFILKVPLT